MQNFTNLYSVSKTLRFELIPQGKTLEHIQNKKLLTQDEVLAQDYQRVKKIIDAYHKDFIEKALKNVVLDEENLSAYSCYYNKDKRNDAEKKKFKSIQTDLRKQIVASFSAEDVKNRYKNLFTKELIKEELLNFIENDEDKSLVNKFKNFTTYFTGFNENRKNMYTVEEHSTGIAFRLIHDNLPKFISNISIFEKIKKTSIKEDFKALYDNFSEFLSVEKIEDIFLLNEYTNFLTQSQIDVYNLILGGESKEQGVKIRGLNEYINLYNQNQTDKKSRLPKLKPLFKQILSDRNAISWLPEAFEEDDEVLESIEKFYQDLVEHVFCKEKKGEYSLLQLLQGLNEFDLSGIYIKNDLALRTLSQKIFENYSVFQRAVDADYEKNNPKSQEESNEKYADKKEKYIKSVDSFSIQYLNACVKKLGLENCQTIEAYFSNIGKTEKEESILTQIESQYTIIEDLLKTPYPKNKKLSQDKVNIEKIKLFLDSLKALQWFVEPLLGKGNEFQKDEVFYAELSTLYGELDNITALYNKVRNYATKKPYSDEKIKLNFENSTLLDGWDVNKESDNTSVILRKNGLYYLGIMDKNHNRIFRENVVASDDTYFEKMEYKLLPGVNKMLPKVFFSTKGIPVFMPSETILENYKNETHKKSDNFNLNHCHELIDFFKASINKHEDWKNFDFKFSETKEYQDLSGFYREVEAQGYKITFRNIPENTINQLVEDGKLYLFQIYNKDFSTHSKGTPNLHTIYWKMLFDAENLENVVYKLNGQAEVFYRKASINDADKIVHKANQTINNKNECNSKKTSTFAYDLVKDKRYCVDKFHFHVPITMNFKAKGYGNINLEVNQFLKENKEKIHIIGIDRGERHLLYLSLIDIKGKIVKQFSLNEIVNEYKGNIIKTNYHNLLDKREGNRDKARKSWQTIEGIKELKEGYLSQVVHIITQLMVEYNAIVVLEDLNFGFMRGRQKVEKQVYQKFEKMLIDKLNYLVDKKKQANEWGGTLKALQLTSKFESFQKLGKQSGFLFYIPAWNTSKIDPVTGFVNLFDTKYESIDKAKLFFSKFKDIRFNSSNDYFEFEIEDYSQFNIKAAETKINWTICTNSTRILTSCNTEKNNQWDNKEMVLTNEFKNLFEKHNIFGDYKMAISQQLSVDFFKKLMLLFKLTVQIRNSETGSEKDYLISPVADENGIFYDSRNFEKQKDPALPKDADANGAYNIARKGLWVLDQIEKSTDLEKIKLAISNKEWLQFAQNNKWKP